MHGQLLIVVGMLALVAASLRYARFRVDALHAQIDRDAQLREQSTHDHADRDGFIFNHFETEA
jgi:hypothetical protein